jgi:hypothetical protein
MLRYRELKETRSRFLTITGAPPEEFEHYLPQFIVAYDELYPYEKTVDGQPGQQQSRESVPDALGQWEDKLLFIWLYHKAQTLPPALGLYFGLSPSRNYNVHLRCDLCRVLFRASRRRH